MELLGYEFFRNALAGVLIISIAAAVIGSYIMARRMVAIAGGVTHACFGGLGLGYYLGLNPMLMAGVFAVASSLGVDWLASRHRVREDSAIAVIWAVGMAVGVLFIFLTPGYVPELNSFLFGNILTIGKGDIWLFGGYTVALLAFVAWQYRNIVAIAFDRDFAQVAGLPVRLVTMVMTVMVALCIVLAIKLVGVMLLMSLLSLPQLIAEIYFRRFGQIMAASVVISLATCLGGLVLSTVIDVPCSALIVIVMVAAWVVARVARERG